MNKLKTLDRGELYTVGWIAALPIELAAALAMLDERHGQPDDFQKPSSDDNSYRWGQIGDHNIVIASLPAGVYGTISAATTAKSMTSSFPNIKVGLMVGIGAGIARPNQRRDIRLGDVVVSLPRGQSGGVLQYDLGKSRVSEHQGHTAHTFERVGTLSSPPVALLKALAMLQAEVEMEGSKVSTLVEDMLERYPRMAKNEPNKPGYVYQGQDNDKLFEASYIHSSSMGCDDCDPTRIIPRATRSNPDVPEVHYGVIASGNKLVKDAAERDLILKESGEDCICLEMEAAGLMNSFPCLVIRGVCDYADSHKNDGWQKYAAATAAAYAKEFLGFVENQDLAQTMRAIEILQSMSSNINELATNIRDTGETIQELRLSHHENEIRDWLSAPDPSVNYINALEKRHEGTGVWFVGSHAFADWKKQPNSFLWLHGIPGCGKTILSSTIIERLSNVITPEQVLLYFYFDFNDANKQTLENMLRSLVTQLYQAQLDSRGPLDQLWKSSKDGNQQLSKSSLRDALLAMLRGFNDVSIVLDALDESTTRSDVLAWLWDVLGAECFVGRILVTARREEDIESSLQRWMRPEEGINIQKDYVNEDIRAYVSHTLRNSDELDRWFEKPEVQNEIETELVKGADGMFRWVACQIDNLKNCLDYRTLRQALETLPKTLDETYARILEGIPGAYSAHAATILNLLIWSDKTFGIRTLVDAIATDIDGSPAFDPKNRMPVPREVLKLCSSLVAVSQHVEYPDEDQVRLAHFSVKEYLVSNHVSRAFKSLIAEKAARSYLARLCLTYLMDVNQLILRGSSIGELDFDDICREFPFLRYSTLNWMDHARDVENEDERLYEMMLSFFSEGHKTFSLFGKLFDRFNRSVTFAGIVLDMREDLNHDPWHDPAHRRSPLFYAASGGLRRVVEYLLDTGAEINLDEGAALNAALDKGQETTARLLLDRGADVNLGRGRALIEAAHYGDDPIVQLLLDRGANTNARHGEALAIAVEYGRDTTVQVLLDRGADVNAGRGKALLRAIHVDHETAIQLLLDRGANVNVRNGKALIEAVHCGEATLHLLLDRGADINAKRGQALTRAIYYKDTIAQLLLDRGADVNAGNGEALLAAVVRDQEATVQLLLDKGANVNARAGQALRVAVEKGKDMMVQSLLKGGAHVYGTALLLTLDSFLHTNVPLHSLQDTTIQLLIDRGANPDMHRGSTLTALQDISKEAYGRLVRHLLQDDISRAKALELDWLKDYLRIARLLIDKGADTKLPGIDWLEILRTGDWSVQIVENILERSAFLSANHLLSAILDTNPQAEAIVSIMLSYLSLATAAKELDEETQWNMMHYAAICGSEIVTQRCLDLGVNVNAHDRDGRTALHHAAHFRHLVIVKMLVRAGSDPHTSDVNGERPLTCVADDHSDSYWLAIDKGWRGQTPRDDIIRYLRRCMFYRLLFVSQTKKSQVRFRSGRRSRKTTYRAYRRRGKSIGDNIRPAKKRAFRWMSSDSDSDNSSSSRRRSSDFSF